MRWCSCIPAWIVLVRKEDAVTDELSIDRISRLSGARKSLRPSQPNWIESVVEQFGRPATFWWWDEDEGVRSSVVASNGRTL